MPSRNALTRFFGWLILYYGLMIVPWPGVRPFYADVLRKDFANFALGLTNLDRSFQVHSVKSYREHMKEKFDVSEAELNPTLLRGDMILVYQTPGGQQLTISHVSHGRLGYLSLAAFIALTFASPVDRRRRLRVLSIGLPIIIAFIMVQMSLIFLNSLAEEHGMLVGGRLVSALRTAAYLVLVAVPVNRFVVVAAVWAPLTFGLAPLSILVKRATGRDLPEPPDAATAQPDR